MLSRREWEGIGRGLEIHEVAIIGWDVYATNFIPFYNTLEIRAMIRRSYIYASFCREDVRCGGYSAIEGVGILYSRL